MNLIKLTLFTPTEDKGYESHVNYEIIDFIADTENGALVYFNRTFGNEGKIRVKETAKEIRDEIAKIETNKMIDKINYQQSANAISKDWTEDMYEKVDAKKE